MNTPQVSGRKSRRTRSPRFSFEQNLVSYMARPVSWQLVCPGETLDSMKIQYRFKSGSVVVGGVGGYLETRVFYVPMRLMWESWPDFLMGKTAFAFPTYDDLGLVLANATKFGATAITDAAYPVAAAKRVHEDWYAPGDDDPAFTGSQGQVPRADKTFVSGTLQDAEDVDATVATTGDVLKLSDLEDAYVQRDQDRLENVIDGDYLRYLQMAGVSAVDQALQRSEPVYRHRKWIEPAYTFGDAGALAERYHQSANLSVHGRRYFAEHGILLTCVAFMPKIYTDVNSFLTALTKPEHFPSAAQVYRGDVIEFATGAGNPVEASALDLLRFGEDQHERGGGGVLEYSPTTRKQILWPDPTTVNDALFGAATYPQIDGVVSSKFKTPVL